MSVKLRKTLFGLLVCTAFCVSTAFAENEALSVNEVRWPKGTIKISLSTSFRNNTVNIKPGADVSTALARALSRWESVAAVEFELLSSESVSVSPAGRTGDDISLFTIEATQENFLLFTKDRANSAAITRVFYNRQNEITEADIVLNPMFQFSTDGSLGTFDLERVFTHEVGHLLGLKHSILSSSVMFEEVPKNGSLGSPESEFELSADDISSIRSLYGAQIDDLDCCSSITGIITNLGKSDNSIVVVDAATGSVQQAVAPASNGKFSVKGLMPGRYEIWSNTKGESFGDLNLGTISVRRQESKPTTLPLSPRRADFSIEYIGSDGQLAKRPVRLVRGETNRILLSGQNLDQKGFRFGSNSPFITILSTRDISTEFGGGANVFRLDIKVAESTPNGRYSVFAQNSQGVRKHSFGTLIVE